MPQYVDRTNPLEEQVHRLFERHEARKRRERMTEEQFETLKHWIEAVVYSAISDPDGNSNGKLYRVQEDRARELLTEAMPRYAKHKSLCEENERLRAALKPFVDATINADLKRLEHNDLFIRLTWPSSKGHTYFADMVPQRFIDARTALEGDSK